MKLFSYEKIANRRILNILGLKLKFKTKFKSNFKKKLKSLNGINRKIIVYFLVNDIAKWKTESLYRYMMESKEFEPYIALTVADAQLFYSKEKRVKSYEETKNFFLSKNFKCIDAYNPDSDTIIDLKEFDFDIIFYQQPWGLNKLQDSPYISQFALTCYVPYYVSCNLYSKLDVELDFHKYLWKYYILNKEWKDFYSKFNINLVAVGHTMLDDIYLNKDKINDEKKYLIYAPHWSINHPNNKNPLNLATFMDNGFKILNYAKAHPEFNWVFKPHPDLELALSRVGYTDKEIDDYYNAWNEIGMCCYDSNYMKLFLNSIALITDCGSFLMEYFCTGKPLIHLKSQNEGGVEPSEPVKKIVNLHYKAYNFEELEQNIQEIVIKGNDYLKEERLRILNSLGLLNNYAAENIVNDLLKSIKEFNCK